MTITRKFILSLTSVAALLLPASAFAQVPTFNSTGAVVTACGSPSPFAAFTVGRAGPFTVDANGNMCINGTFTGTVTVTFPTIGAAVPGTGVYTGINVGGTLTGATGGTTGADTITAPTGALDARDFVYVFNGTTWDRLKGDATNGAFVNVKVLPALVAGSAIIGKVGIDPTTNLVSLSAETTKVIGVVRTADGSGNLLTSTGNALDVNIKSGFGTTIAVTQGTSPWVVSGTTVPTRNTGAYAAATITNSSAQALAAATAVTFLDIVNESATATIACNFGGTAVINGAGSITIPPNWHRSWEGSFVPTDAVNCISSVASSAATIGAK